MLADSTYDGYRRNVERHVVPALGGIALRRLRPTTSKPSTNGCSTRARPLRRSRSQDRVRGAPRHPRRPCGRRRRGLVTRNVALVAHAPRLRSIPKVEQQAWTADELQAFLRAAAGHRHFPALWVAAFTGMRRNELLGLRWNDFDERTATISVNRGLIAVPYELHETRGKTPRPRLRIDLDPTSVNVMLAWRSWQQAEHAAVGDRHRRLDVHRRRGEPLHPHAISQSFERIARRRRCESSACTTCATLTARCSN